MEALIVNRYEDMVTVCSAIGCFTGHWCSLEKAEIRRYVLELDTSEILCPEAIEISPDCRPRIVNDGDGIIFNGFVEEIQDSVLVLRIDKTLLMIELSSGFDFSIFVNQYVRIKLIQIDLYDTEMY